MKQAKRGNQQHDQNQNRQSNHHCFSLVFAILLALGLASPGPVIAQTVLHLDDFETRDMSAWSGITQDTWDSANNGASTVSSTIAHSGLYSLKETLPVAGGNAKLLSNIASSTDLYWRYYIYIDPAWTQTNMVVLSSIGGGGEQIWLRKSGSNLLLQDADGRQGTHAISTGAWHAIEIHSKTGSGNGIATVWIDGVQDINATNLTIAGPFTVVYLGFDNADGTQSGSIYFDDSVVQSGGSPMGTAAANITVRYPNTNARTAFPVDVTMWGAVSTDILTAKVDGSTIFTKTGSMTQHERFTVAITSLTVASHSFQVQLQDSGGTAKATFNGSFTVYHAGIPTVSIDGQNNLYKSGQKFFPISPYIDGIDEWSNPSDSFDNHWSLRGAVNLYGWRDCYNGSGYNYTEFNTCMTSANAPFIGPDNSWTGTTPLPANDPNAVTNATAYVTNDKGNANLFMWTWQDEPAGQVALARMTALSQAVWSNDGNHPVAINFASYPYSVIQNRQGSWYYPIIPNSADLSADVFAGDMYPFIYSPNPTAPPANWYVYQMIDGIDREQRYNYGLVPFIAFIEVGVCSTGKACAGHGPTPAQVTMESWLGVIHGLKGISWWGPGSWTTQSSGHWAAAAQFVTDATHFKDAILSSTTRTISTNRNGTLGQDSRVDCAVREDSSYIYGFCARLTDVGESGSALSTQITISGMNGTATATRYNEIGNVTFTNGVATDSFNDSAVHIYQIAVPGAPSVSPSSISFGEVTVGSTSADQAATITNNTGADLSISAVTVSGTGFSHGVTSDTCTSTLAAGANCNVYAKFSPTSPGVAIGSLEVDVDSVNTYKPSIYQDAGSLSATSPTNAYDADADLATYAIMNGSDDRNTDISFNTQTTYSWSNSIVGSPTSVVLSVTSQGINSGGCRMPTTAMVVSYSTDGVTFTPVPNQSGVHAKRTDTISLATNQNLANLKVRASASCSLLSGSGQDTIRLYNISLTVNTPLPSTIALSGTGIAPTAGLAPASHSFGNQLAGTTSSAQVFTLSNTGTATLNIASIGVTGDFAETHVPCGSTLAVASSCDISVTFTPTAAGARSGTLTVTDDSDGVAGSTQTASLSGTGLALPALRTTGGGHKVGGGHTFGSRIP